AASRPENPGACWFGRDRGEAIRHIPTAKPRRLALDRAYQRQALPAGLRPPLPVPRGRPGEVLRSATVTAVLHVIDPGLFTTVQDLGRLNAISSGVQPGGAMDRFAHSAANLLV